MPKTQSEIQLGFDKTNDFLFSVNELTDSIDIIDLGIAAEDDRERLQKMYLATRRLVRRLEVAGRHFVACADEIIPSYEFDDIRHNDETVYELAVKKGWDTRDVKVVVINNFSADTHRPPNQNYQESYVLLRDRQVDIKEAMLNTLDETVIRYVEKHDKFPEFPPINSYDTISSMSAHLHHDFSAKHGLIYMGTKNINEPTIGKYMAYSTDELLGEGISSEYPNRVMVTEADGSVRMKRRDEIGGRP